jgi:hypothetical protein
MTENRPQINPKLAWGFEERVCSRCGETKGGNLYRLCRCQREERCIKDGQQPNLCQNSTKNTL